jgi:hypothetical protein
MDIDNFVQLYRSENSREVAMQIFISGILELSYSTFLCLYDKLSNVEKLELNVNLTKIRPTFWLEHDKKKNQFIQDLLSSDKTDASKIIELKKFFCINSIVEAKELYNSLTRG